jgi:hypothetical protein
MTPDVPKLITATLRCSSAELAYAIDDEVSVSNAGAYATSFSVDFHGQFGLVYGADDTDVFYRVMSGGFILPDKGTGALAPIDPTKWKLIIRAWK